MENFMYYAMVLVVMVIGLFILKKVATCMIKTVVGIIMLAVLGILYWVYFC